MNFEKKIFVLVLILFFMIGCSKKEINEQNNNDFSKKQAIKDISIGYKTVVALSETGDLYVIGEDKMYGLGLGDDVDLVSEPTKVAEGVKSFLDEGSAIYYINNNNELYHTGLRLKGGVEDSFVKIQSNVSSFSAYSGFCITSVDLNGDLTGIVSSFVDNGTDCGLSKDKYSDFTKIASSVKQSFVIYGMNGYINNNNELFFSDDEGMNYTKVMENVKEVFNMAGTLYILTLDNYLYDYDCFENNFKKLSDGVIDVHIKDKFYFEFEDGNLYYYNYNYNEFQTLKYDNIKKIFYSNGNKYVYLNNDNKIELRTEYDEYVLENDVSSIKQILEFVSN